MTLLSVLLAILLALSLAELVFNENKMVVKILLCALIAACYIITLIQYEHKDAVEETESNEIAIQKAEVDLNFEDSVYQYILFLNIKHPDVVLRQARVESGNFKSKVFKENNNMFGMKVPYKRPNTVIGTNRGYAVYEHWKDCVVDYALYQTYSGKSLSRDEYVNMLNRSYAEDPNYDNKIK